VAVGRKCRSIARPQQRLPARGPGHGIIAPQQRPGQFRGSRHKQVHRGVILAPRHRRADRRTSPKGCRGVRRRNQSSYAMRDSGNAATHCDRSATTSAWKSARGAKCSTHCASNSAAPTAAIRRYASQRPSQAAASARKSATEARWIRAKVAHGQGSWKQSDSQKHGILFETKCPRETPLPEPAKNVTIAKEKKGISPICVKHPPGRSGRLDLPFFLSRKMFHTFVPTRRRCETASGLRDVKRELFALHVHLSTIHYPLPLLTLPCFLAAEN